MKCVSSTSYQFMINGDLTHTVLPQRGLRQGDPLSPYLFLLCAEGLGAMIKRAYVNRSLHGVSIARNAPTITHLFFADDSVIITRATVSEAETILCLLKEYEVMSRQMINMEKSEVSFKKGLSHEDRERIRDKLSMCMVDHHERYFGLPTHFSRAKKLSFSSIRERISKKLKGWKERLMSRACKEILIKAVAQSITTYAMSCFLLPESFCQEVTRIIRNFWWSSANNSSGIPWKAWNHLCLSKDEGGIGFHDLTSFNKALLAKQFWRLHLNPNSILSRTLKARYYPLTSVWESKVGNNPSFSWRSVRSSRDLVEKGTRWRIGDGKSVRIWKDAWMGDNGTGKLITPWRHFEADAKVSLFIDEVNRCWRKDVL